MRERLRYLDYAKGIGIICIMLAHCIQYFKPMSPLNKFICSFHVPVFFVVAGFLAWINRDKKITNIAYIKKRACLLLIPYVIYSIFNSTLKLGVLALKHAITAEAFQDEMIALLITGNGTVWFLLTLFLVEVFFKILKSRVEKYTLFFSAAFLIIPYLLYPYLHNPVGIVFIRAIAASGFYYMGYTVCGFLNREKATPNTSCIMTVCCFLAGVASYCILGSNYAFFDGKFAGPIYSLITGVLLSISVVLMCKCIEDFAHNDGRFCKLLEYFGKNSLIVMLIHPTILLLFTYPFAEMFWNMEGAQSVGTAIFLFVVIVIMQIPVIYVVNRWFSWTLGRKKKVEKNG